MKLVRKDAEMALVTCGTLCDRCGATELDQPADEAGWAAPTFVTITMQGLADELLRGHFCPDCIKVLGGNTEVRTQHLRRVSQAPSDGDCVRYRFQVQLAATGERIWIESLLSEDELM